jgi:hypothetical protein
MPAADAIALLRARAIGLGRLDLFARARRTARF